MAEVINVVVASSESTKGLFDSQGGKRVPIPVEKLKSSLDAVVDSLKTVTSDIWRPVGGLQLLELNVDLEISAEGGINLIGSAKVGASSSLKLKFGRA